MGGPDTPNSHRFLMHHDAGYEGSAFAFFDSFFNHTQMTIIAPTLPGYGCSTPQLNRDIHSWPHDIELILEHEGWLSEKYDVDGYTDGIQTFHVVGYGVGAPHALSTLLSDRLTSRIAGILAIEPPLSLEAKEKFAQNVSLKKRGSSRYLFSKSYESVVVRLRHFLGRLDRVKWLSRLALYTIYNNSSRVDVSDDTNESVNDAEVQAWLNLSWNRVISKGIHGVVDVLNLLQQPWIFIRSLEQVLQRRHRAKTTVSSPLIVVRPKKVC